MYCNPLTIARQLNEPVVVDEHVNDVADLAVRWNLGYCPWLGLGLGAERLVVFFDVINCKTNKNI